MWKPTRHLHFGSGLFRPHLPLHPYSPAPSGYDKAAGRRPQRGPTISTRESAPSGSLHRHQHALVLRRSLDRPPCTGCHPAPLVVRPGSSLSKARRPIGGSHTTSCIASWEAPRGAVPRWCARSHACCSVSRGTTGPDAPQRNATRCILGGLTPLRQGGTTAHLRLRSRNLAPTLPAILVIFFMVRVSTRTPSPNKLESVG
jgi:hypothetical protein